MSGEGEIVVALEGLVARAKRGEIAQVAGVVICVGGVKSKGAAKPAYRRGPSDPG